jgi:hypothetical protein
LLYILPFARIYAVRPATRAEVAVMVSSYTGRDLMPTQMYLVDLARRCRFLSDHTLDLRMARELRSLGIELEQKAREAQLAADAAAPALVQRFAPIKLDDRFADLSLMEIRAAAKPVQA